MVSMPRKTSCCQLAACSGARQASDVHSDRTAGASTVASTVATNSSARKAVMMRLMKASPPSASLRACRTIWGTSTVFSAPPARIM
jgi:hypothetical protein